jgi:hypothetical protein
MGGLVKTTTIALALLLLAGTAQAQDKGRGNGKAGGELSDRDHARLALFAVEKLEAGVTGEALESALREKLEALQKERKDDKGGDKDQDKNGPGEALRHGLEDKDLTNFGRFVNEQLAAGLRGTKLADAIHSELKKLKENRAKQRENGKGEGKPDNAGKGAKGKGK